MCAGTASRKPLTIVAVVEEVYRKLIDNLRGNGELARNGPESAPSPTQRS
jgi:hypothetical protein